MNVYFVNFMLLAHFELCQSRRYDNFTIYSATPTEQYQLNFLQNLRSEKYIDVIFWKKPSKLFNDVHFMVNPIDSALFQERLDHFRLEAHTLIPNIQSAFDSQKIKKYTSLKIDSFTWDSYHSLEDIYQWISDVALKFPKTVELHSIGKSVEGRDIYAIFIKKSNSKANVVIDAGIHGHEWISTAFVTFLIKKLIYAQDIGDERLNELANKYNWFIIPIVNPDGFDYSIKVPIATTFSYQKLKNKKENHIGSDLLEFPDNEFPRRFRMLKDCVLYLCKKVYEALKPINAVDGLPVQIKDRLWRKNRRKFDNGEGVDLNRNFDHSFGKYETSTNPKDDNYCGPAPFSEPESRALSNFITEKRENLKFYISFHAYGQKIIIPYGDRVKHVENFSEMDNYGKQAILRMYKLNGVKYSIGTTYDTLGIRVSGSSSSWVKNNYKTKYVITFLLRDNGTYGFALPNEQIMPTCQETLVGLVELMTAKPRRVRMDLLNASRKVTANMMLLITLCFLK